MCLRNVEHMICQRDVKQVVCVVLDISARYEAWGKSERCGAWVLQEMWSMGIARNVDHGIISQRDT